MYNRSRDSNGPLAKNSHLASYLCSIASDEHGLPKRPGRMAMDPDEKWDDKVSQNHMFPSQKTFFNGQNVLFFFCKKVSFSQSLDPSLDSVPEGEEELGKRFSTIFKKQTQNVLQYKCVVFYTFLYKNCQKVVV